MLPSEDALWVGEELARRFGLPLWQFALTATDANRFAIRLARAITGRPKILVFNWCYHGTVDETFATLGATAASSRARATSARRSTAAETTRVVEFNDIEALERALAHGDVACVLAEPALTNIGIVLPEPGYHEALRELTRRTGTLLIIDETHTICAGPGGYTARARPRARPADDRQADRRRHAGRRLRVHGARSPSGSTTRSAEDSDVGGIGGTLAGNALSLAAMRATLAEVLTEEAFARMIALGERFEAGVQPVDRRSTAALARDAARLPRRVPVPPEPPAHRRRGRGRGRLGLDRFMHLYALNRGILLTPFHNMALMSPATTEADVDRHTEVFAEAAAELTAA